MAPTIITTGAGSAKGFGYALAAPKLISLVNSANATPSGSTPNETVAVNMSTFGCQAGDIFFFFITDYDNTYTPAVSGGAGGWSADAGAWAYPAYMLYKKLAAGDITTITFSPRTGYKCFYCAFRGIGTALTAATLKQFANNASLSQSTLTFTGITKNANSKGLFLAYTDRDNTATWTSPSPFTQYNAGSDGAFSSAMSYLPSPSLYNNGTNIVLTTTGTTYWEAGYFYELT